MKVYTTSNQDYMPKPRLEWTFEEMKKANLDNVVKDILFKMLNTTIFNKVKAFKMAKQIWNKITMIYERSDQIKENKLTLVMQKFNNFNTKLGGMLNELDSKFTMIKNELSSFNKEYLKRKMILKSLACPT